MKKTLCLCLCLALLTVMALPVSAADTSVPQGTVIHHEELDLGNGITAIDEIVDISQARAIQKTYARTRTFKQSDVVIAIITIEASFVYDGTSVYVSSKSVTRADTYEGWSYVQNSFTSSGGTVTLDAKLTKLLVLNKAFTITLSCDKDGNIT